MVGKETCPSLEASRDVVLVWTGHLVAVAMRNSLLESKHNSQGSFKEEMRAHGVRTSQDVNIPVFWINRNFRGVATADVGGGHLIRTNR